MQPFVWQRFFNYFAAIIFCSLVVVVGDIMTMCRRHCYCWCVAAVAAAIATVFRLCAQLLATYLPHGGLRREAAARRCNRIAGKLAFRGATLNYARRWLESGNGNINM